MHWAKRAEVETVDMRLAERWCQRAAEVAARSAGRCELSEGCRASRVPAAGVNLQRSRAQGGTAWAAAVCQQYVPSKGAMLKDD